MAVASTDDFEIDGGHLPALARAKELAARVDAYWSALESSPPVHWPA